MGRDRKRFVRALAVVGTVSLLWLAYPVRSIGRSMMASKLKKLFDSARSIVTQ